MSGSGGFDGNAEPAPPRTQNQHAERRKVRWLTARWRASSVEWPLLHADSSYRDIAVLAPRADYAGDARRTLARLAPSVDPAVDSALYALALDEYLKIESFPHAS